MPRTIRRLAVALLVAVLAVAGHSQASAHAVLVDSAPADRQRLSDPPGHVELRFNEPVEVMALRLIGPDGLAVPLVPDAGGPPDRATAPLPALGGGTHVLSWRLVSADGHPVAGSLLFTVGAPGAAVPAGRAAAAADIPPLLSVAHGVARTVAYAAGLFATGSVLFLLLFGRNPAVEPAAIRRPALAAAAVAVLATLGVAALQSAMLGLDVAALPHIPPAMILRLCGLGAVAVGLAWRRARPVGACGALAVAVSYPWTGHTAPLGSFWLSGLLAFHSLAAAFWVGALWPLIRASRQGDRAGPDRTGAARLMAGFSRIAVVLVPALVLAGGLLAWRLAGGWAGLASPYGIVLLLKTAAVGGMLGLAAWNRARLVPAFGQDGGAARLLRRSMQGEAALALLVLAATSGLTSLPPPGHGAGHGAGHDAGRAVAGGTAHDGHHHHAPGHAPEPLSARAVAGPLSLDLVVSPGWAGENTIDLRLSGPDGAPRDALSVGLRIGSPDLGVEDIIRPMRRLDSGHYRLDGPELASPGRWRITAELLVGDFEKRMAVMTIDVAAPDVAAPDAAAPDAAAPRR